MEARRNVRVLSFVTVARRLQLVVSFEFNSFHETFHDLRGRLRVNTREGLLQNLVNEGDHLGCESLVSCALINISPQVVVLDVFGGLSGHETHVRSAFERVDWEQILLGCFNVVDLMPVGFCQSSHAHKTVLGSAEGQRWNLVVKERVSVVSDRVLVSQQDGTHQHLALNQIRVILGVVLGHHTSERVSSQKDIVSFKASFSQFRDSLGDVVVDQERLRG